MTKSWNTAKRQLATCPSYPHEIKNCSYIVKCQSWRGKHPHIISKFVPKKNNLDNKRPRGCSDKFLAASGSMETGECLCHLDLHPASERLSPGFFRSLLFRTCDSLPHLREKPESPHTTFNIPFLIKVRCWTQGSSCRVAVNPRVFLATFVLWL